MMHRGRLLRSAGVGAAATPVAIALLARWSLGGAPPSAHATVDETDRAPIAVPLPRLSNEERNVIEYARASLAQPLGASPLHGMSAEPVDAGGEEPTVVANTAPTETPAPAFHVRSVLISSKGALATINGRLRRIGDEIEPNWRLRAIDVDRGLVRIDGPDDQFVEIPIGRLIR